MEKKNNNGVLIGLLIGIIVMLLVFVCLFATNTISFNSKNTNDKTKGTNKEVNEKNNTLTGDEAVKLIKTKLNFVVEYFDTLQVPCGDDAEIDNSVPFKNGNPYYKSKQFSSYNELNEYLLQYMSQDIISQHKFYKKEYYLEKDGSLYCLMSGKGSGDPRVYVPEKTKYLVNNISTNSIDFTITVYYEAPSNISNNGWGENYSKTYNVVLTKFNDNWQITKYEEQ